MGPARLDFGDDDDDKDGAGSDDDGEEGELMISGTTH